MDVTRAAAIVANPRLQVAGALLATMAAATLLYVADPATSALFPPSPFRALTGLYCPGCGSLRALHQLLHGNLAAALHYNVLTVLALPFLAYAFVSEGLRALGGRGLPRVFVPRGWILALLALIVAFWVLRNIPVAPFTLLAP